MKVLNASEAYEFMDGLCDHRKKSAVIAIHERWLDHTSPLARKDRLEPESSLDYMVLYQAAANTFASWPPQLPSDGSSCGGRVINRERALAQLQNIDDEETRLATNAFAREVIALSAASEELQDLNYFVELFLKTVEDPRVIQNIVSGEISRHSDLIAADPDCW